MFMPSRLLKNWIWSQVPASATTAGCSTACWDVGIFRSGQLRPNQVE